MYISDMPTTLPTKLGKEPLLEAVFEIRFFSEISASSILPGILFSRFGGRNIEPQPIAQLPKQMRDADPNLKFAPLVRIQRDDYIFLIGDQSVAIACKIPYPGWNKFRDKIKEVVNILGESKVIGHIQRYSLKYVDLIPFSEIKQQVSSVNLHITLGDYKLEKEVFHFKIEIPQNEFIHVVQILSSAFVTLQDNTTKQGLVVNIDSIRNIKDIPLDDFIREIDGNLNIIHQKNKEMFFKCLTSDTLSFLEPTYESI